MKVEVSNGELVDKYTILLIKSKKITDRDKLDFITAELHYLEPLVRELNIPSDVMDELCDINERLWGIEDDIRKKERKREKGKRFIQLARSVYLVNDKRADVKRRINFLTNSTFREIKEHPLYKDVFLYYNFSPSLCDYVLDIPKEYYLRDGIIPKHPYKHFKGEDIKENQKVFVKVDLLPTFFNDYYPRISNAFYLMSGVGGMDVNESFRKYLDEGKIKKWIGCNIVWEHPKVVKVPIGFEEVERSRLGPAKGEGGDQHLLHSLHQKKRNFEDKADNLLITHLGNTHHSRKNVEEKLDKLKCCCVIEKVPFEMYMNFINKFKFVLCPRGSGTDTHRFWEILLMGSVPVVERNGLSDFYENFPCIIVDSFEDITEETFMDYEYKNEENVYKYLYLDKFTKLIESVCKKK